MYSFNSSFRQHIVVLVVFSVIIGWGCKSTRHLQKGERLLKQNEIRGVKLNIKNKLFPYIRQKPNSRLLGITPIELWLYNIGKNWSEKKENKVNQWLMNKVGEAPVVYDSSKAAKSTKLLRMHLRNIGYLNAQTQYRLKTKKKKKVSVIYEIHPGHRYYINKVHFKKEPGSKFNAFLKQAAKNTVLRKTEPYRVDKVNEERNRITRFMRNQGFLYFSKEYVHFQVDTNMAGHKLDIYIKLLQPQKEKVKNRYTINEVLVYPDYKSYRGSNKVTYDTIEVENFEGFKIITKNKSAYNWKVILNAILLKPGTQNELQDKYDITLNRLADLGIFNYVDIRFHERSPDTANKSTQGPPLLNCMVYLAPSKTQEMSVELEGNTETQTNMGAVLKYTYRNKNLFKGAEVFSFNVNGGIESQIGYSPFFNTLDLTGQVNLKLPRFLFPINRRKLSSRLNPKTTFSLSSNFQKRPDLSLTSTNLKLSYDWREYGAYNIENLPYKHHLASPIVINYVNAGNFSERIEELRRINPQVRKSLANQLIIGGSYQFIHDASFTGAKNYWFYSINLDISGNLLKGANLIANNAFGYDSSFTFFGINYSQFAKIDLEARRYIKVSKHSKLATRVRGGVGVPYGNSSVLPYVKQFFTGGSNGIRAWRVRTLGPGSYNFRKELDQTSNYIDQTGDIIFEGNIEYRYDIFQWIKGAFFLDMGNVWSLKSDTSRPGAVFDSKNFVDELALGTGFGLRLDFSFFILRFDTGAKLRDPSFEDSEQWVITRFKGAKLRRLNLYADDYPLLNFNIAIGYPF